MKNYKVKFDGRISVYFSGVTLCECMVADSFKVVRFLRDGVLVAEFFPDDYFTFEIRETLYS